MQRRRDTERDGCSSFSFVSLVVRAGLTTSANLVIKRGHGRVTNVSGRGNTRNTLVRLRSPRVVPLIVGASVLEDPSEIFTAPEIPDGRFSPFSLSPVTSNGSDLLSSRCIMEISVREISVFKVGTRALMHLCITVVDRATASIALEKN